jgi:predicted TIM-barrel fold metal-dependent hydrolase
MGWIDADAHVVESPRTWDYLTPSEKKFRPMLFKPEDETQKAHWVIDGKIRGLFRFTFTQEDLIKKSAEIGRDMTTTMATRDLADVPARIKHMDDLGIDIQVLYPSIFLDQCTERPDTEVALCGAYNRWLADVWKESEGRLRWMATLPLLSMPERSTSWSSPKRTARAESSCALSRERDRLPTRIFFRCTRRRGKSSFASACTRPTAAPRRWR